MRLWRVSDGKLLHTLTGHKSKLLVVAFSADGTTLISASEDGGVHRWRVQ